VRGAAVRARLDVADELRSQLRAPAGLDVGARSPGEVAISILAELVAARRDLDPVRPAARAVATDPVCGMEVAIGPAAIQLELDGERRYFCCAGCRDRFAAEHAASR
jgi:xanthine dehydrogenase accessory factor